VVIVSIAVVSRYVFNAPFTWPEELARFSLVALTFFGSALATKRGEHLVVNFLGAFLQGRPLLWMTLLVGILQCAFLLLLTILGIQMLDRLWVVVSPALSIRMGYVYLCIPIGTSLMIVHLLPQLRGTARALWHE